MKFEYWKSTKDSNWYWHLKASNNERIAYGEGYKNKADVLQVIKLVQGSSTAPISNLTPQAA